MISIWSGFLDLESESDRIQDVRLESPHPQASLIIPPGAGLQFLSAVYTAAVPLYLSAGPSLNVCIQDEGSEKRLHDALFNRENEQPQEHDVESQSEGRGRHTSLANGQSRLGLLFHIGEEAKERPRTAATEILIYGTQEEDRVHLPSPPRSSSPAITSSTLAASLPSRPPRNNEYRYHALPLCSNNIHRAIQASGLCTPPHGLTGPCFLPERLVDLEAAVRKYRMTSVFDAATQKRRKSKAKGGESVSKTMAGLQRSQSECQRMVLPTVESGQTQDRNLNNSLVRSSSETHMSSVQANGPVARRGEAHSRKRSSLHRVESACTSGEIESSHSASNTTMEQNKAAFSKIIMAGMRLYGLQQRKRPTTSASHASQAHQFSSLDIMDTPTEEDEYKQVYHQTLKAALFTYRKYCSSRLIPQDSMRDLVDRLLAIFCSDPLTTNTICDSGELLQTPGFTFNGQERDNPFDAPSSSAARAEVNIWSTPVHNKKRKRLDLLDPD